MGNVVRGEKPTATIHPNYGNLDDALKVTDGQNVIRDGVHAIIFHGHNRLSVIGELRKDIAEQYNWTRENIEAFITMPVDGAVLAAIDIMKNSKPIKIVSSKALPCVSFLDRLGAVIVYARTLDECNTEPFREAHLIEIRRDMVSAKFIPRVQDNKYNR